MGKYRVIYADPPWSYNDKSLRFGKGKRAFGSAANWHYETMKLEDIKAVEVPAEDDSYLFLWVTNPLIREGFQVMEAWGFEYKTMITWVKPSIRLGYYFRGRTEHLLFGTRGKPGRLLRHDLGNVINAPITKHSQKPESVYELIEQACDGPYLEMFARRRRHGWDVHGNQAPVEYYPKQEKIV